MYIRNKLVLLLYHAGVLCGACRDNQGVSALLDHCISCSNVSALLILALSEGTVVFQSNPSYNSCGLTALFPFSHGRCVCLHHSTEFGYSLAGMDLSICVLLSGCFTYYSL